MKGFRTRHCCIAVLAALTLFRVASAAGFDEEAQKDLADALKRAAGGESIALTDPAFAPLTDASIDAEAWATFFKTHFESHDYTLQLNTFWEKAISAAGAHRGRLAFLSALSASTSLGANLKALQEQRDARTYEELAAPLRWLVPVLGALDQPQTRAIAGNLADGLAGRLEGLAPLAGFARVGDPYLAGLGVQLCLTFGDYVARGGGGAVDTARVLGLREPALQFWAARNILLFDNNLLSPQHLASLDSLFAAIPPGLHSIGAVIVPEGTGIGAVGNGLMVVTGQIVYIPAVPMNRLTDATEFVASSGRPVAAEFTIQAGQEIVRAIQAQQFARRPELRIRRDVILWNAGYRSTAYLRRHIAPQVFLNSPDDLLPADAYLYLTNTAAALQTAYNLWTAGQHEAMDQFLLLMDLFSGGGNQSVFYSTTPAGAVAVTTVPVARTYLTQAMVPWQRMPGLTVAQVPVSVTYLTGFIYANTRWQFDVSARGIVSRLHSTPAG